MANQFNLTPRAKDDLRNIWNYTLSAWGIDQADQYAVQLYERFYWLAEHPFAGKHRPEISQDYYCFPHRSHLVFYLIRGNAVDIIGIIHKEMDIQGYFDVDI